jgi:trehalose 6-phosphate phosphatase
MKDALSAAALAELTDWVAGKVLLAFDLDGTLAPLAARPDEALVPDDVQHLLAVLAVRTAVAIITGRAVRDARRMLWFTPRYVIGSHGAEGLPNEDAATASYAEMCRRWSLEIARSGVRERIPGTLLEDKLYSLALHYRLTRQPDESRRALLDVIATLSPPPRVVEGKRVLNLVPPQARHKGEALRVLIAHAGVDRALYIGDDVTDEDVFALRLPGVHTIRVEPEGPTAAAFYLRRQADVPILLREISRMMAAAPRRGADYSMS